MSRPACDPRSVQTNFFVLGAAKCGTTALQHYLNQHGDVFMSEPEETRFFDFHYERGLSYYRETFFARWRGQGAVGEATPHYLLLPFAAARIRSAFPASRHIVIVRDPARRAFSHWWMEYSAGREPLPFGEAIALAADEVESGATFDGQDGADRWLGFMDAYTRRGQVTLRSGYLSQGFYAEQVSRYQHLFGADRVRVLFLADLARDPGGVVKDLWHFLGVDPVAELGDPAAVNQASSRAGRRVERILQRTGVQRYVPARLKAVLKRPLARLGRKATITEDARRDLVRYFEPHTRRLEELTGRDLSSWSTV